MRTAIVTGGNAGLGFHCARTLLCDARAEPWRVVLACRDRARAQTATTELEAAPGRAPGATVEVADLDLASLASIRRFAADVAARVRAGDVAPIDAVVCNAGVQAGTSATVTADGFESTFGVNHLGHFLLLQELRPALSDAVRVAVVASGVHDPAQRTGVPAPAWNAPAKLAHGKLGPLGANDSPRLAGQRRYSTSKLANVYHAYELARRLPAGATANAFDPGLMPGTGLVREAPAAVRWIWLHVLPRALPLLRRVYANTHTPAESGAMLARLVAAPELAHVSGRYFEGARDVRSSAESYDRERAEALWSASESLTARR